MPKQIAKKSTDGTAGYDRQEKTKYESCDTCRFARGTVCCAHPVTVKMPAARWCGEWKEKER